MTIAVKAATDLGLKRSQNEDSHGFWIPEDESRRARRGVLLIVADGMGGSQAGEVASRLAVETVLGVYRSAEDEDIPAVLRRAVEEANRVVHRESAAHPDLQGMGTTCTAVAVRGHDAWLAHVGDSRAYLVRNRAIEQLTRDHSLVAQLQADGHLTADQARSDPRRNVVTRSVGVGETVQVDAEAVAEALEPGDAVVVSSDGLHGVVGDEEIASTVDAFAPEEACQRLIRVANARGGPDNITVIVGRLTAGDDTASGPPERAAEPAASEAPAAPPHPRRAVTPALVLALAGLAVLLALVVLVALRVAH
jgi:protein phosphatase